MTNEIIVFEIFFHFRVASEFFSLLFHLVLSRKLWLYGLLIFMATTCENDHITKKNWIYYWSSSGLFSLVFLTMCCVSYQGWQNKKNKLWRYWKWSIKFLLLNWKFWNMNSDKNHEKFVLDTNEDHDIANSAIKK